MQLVASPREMLIAGKVTCHLNPESSVRCRSCSVGLWEDMRDIIHVRDTLPGEEIGELAKSTFQVVHLVARAKRCGVLDITEQLLKYHLT